MALYNNPYQYSFGVPGQMNQFQQQPVQMPAQPVQQPQQNNNGILWVSGEVGAKSYLVAPGTSVLLMDSESEKFYMSISLYVISRFPVVSPLSAIFESSSSILAHKSLISLIASAPPYASLVITIFAFATETAWSLVFSTAILTQHPRVTSTYIPADTLLY